MRELRCDICGKSVDAEFELCRMLSSYATGDIKDVCAECAADADKMIEQIKTVTRKFNSKALKRYLRIRRKTLKE